MNDDAVDDVTCQETTKDVLKPQQQHPPTDRENTPGRDRLLVRIESRGGWLEQAVPGSHTTGFGGLVDEWKGRR
ncbi:hypothetical protein Pcinc_043264 [Petrolisthes cinctipes]|uniref:Uncharacterized protein n=1 Tax=Petrolisthes cinctipes TaxID=88211 RepID=A0AAE1EG95_PETCI|nr:hypothetical protein Pcinc_043264 [Petrolisthes cinctipes]